MYSMQPCKFFENNTYLTLPFLALPFSSFIFRFMYILGIEETKKINKSGGNTYSFRCV